MLFPRMFWYLAASYTMAARWAITPTMAFTSKVLASSSRRSGSSLAFTAATSASRNTQIMSPLSSSYLVSYATSRRPSNLFMSTATPNDETKKAAKSKDDKQKIVPITLLSGFLGAGKTCTLQHLLENTEGVRVGVIVNDVASVNIDAKLVSGKKNGVVELQNGCACCSLADELLTSVETILGTTTKGKNKKPDFDAIVVELSGVADPIAVKSNWNNAKMQGHPVTSRADVTQVVTLVDASTFGTDWMTWDVAGERDGWVDPADDCAAQRKVPELLAEQVEAADVILINKIDLAGEEQVKIASTLAKTLNEKAIMEMVEYGRVSPEQILQQRKKTQDDEPQAHSHDHAAESSSCTEPDCTDTSHSHSHDHHKEEASSSCADPECNDPTHSHSHSHSHDEAAVAACADPDCTDPTHDHDHSHASTSTDQLGITNFVYKANKPFNLRKLMFLLNEWPVPIKDELDLSILQEAKEGGYEIEGNPNAKSPFIGVLRSKGFCWFAPTKWTGSQDDVWRHDTAMYWSHAGKHFGISSAGKWWGTISQTQMKTYFQDDMDEYERIVKEDFVSEEFKDRRQEIVFIGVGLQEEEIIHALDDCLLTDKGMERYRQELNNYRNTILTAPASGPAGLFDTAGMDHMDMDNKDK